MEWPAKSGLSKFPKIVQASEPRKRQRISIAGQHSGAVERPGANARIGVQRMPGSSHLSPPCAGQRGSLGLPFGACASPRWGRLLSAGAASGRRQPAHLPA